MSKAVIVPKPYYPLFDASVTEIVEPSGRCSAKTTSNEIYAVNLMLSSRLNLEVHNAV